MPKQPQEPKTYDMITVGAGPASIFAALELLNLKPDARILMIEQGKPVEQRICPLANGTVAKCIKCSKHCKITAGFSGSGAFSDGKYTSSNEEDTTLPVGGNLPNYLGVGPTKELIRYTYDYYKTFGATTRLEGVEFPEELAELKHTATQYGLNFVSPPLYHIGTDESHKVFLRIQEHLISRNVKILFESEVVDFIISDNTVRGVTYRKNNADITENAYASFVVAAVGRNGSNWLGHMCSKHNIKSYAGDFDIGVRFELPNKVMEVINRICYEGKVYYRDPKYGNTCRTFCQNPGGNVAREGTIDLPLVNGHSAKAADLKTSNTNLALLVTLNKPNIEYANHITKTASKLVPGGIIVQRLNDLRKGRPTQTGRLQKNSVVPTLADAVPGDLSLVFPGRVLDTILNFIEQMDKLVPGFADKDNLLYAPEAKFYNRIVDLSPELECSVKGLFAIGDGSGLTRGLAQASAAGVYVARIINDRLNNAR